MGIKRMRHPMDPSTPHTVVETPMISITNGRHYAPEIIQTGRLKVLAQHHEGMHVDLPDHVTPDGRTAWHFWKQDYFRNQAIIAYVPRAKQFVLSNLPWGDPQKSLAEYATMLLIIFDDRKPRAAKDYFKNIPLMPDLADVREYMPACRMVGVDLPSHDPEEAVLMPEDLGRGISGRTLPNLVDLLSMKPPILPVSNVLLFHKPAIGILRRGGQGIYYGIVEFRIHHQDRYVTDGARLVFMSHPTLIPHKIIDMPCAPEFVDDTGIGPEHYRALDVPVAHS